MRIRLSVGIIVVLGVLAAQTSVRAQGLNLNSSSGTFGSRTLGGGISSGANSFGRNAFTGGMGGSSLGSNVGALGSTSPVSGGDMQAGQFVGADSGEVQNFMSQMGFGQNTGGRGQQGFGGRGRSAAANQRGGNAGRGGSGGRNRVDIRTTLRVAFDYPSLPAARIGTTLTRRLEKSKQFQAFSGVEVLVRDGTATLRGIVATDADRQLVAQLARLEVGIWQIDNQIVVAQVPSEPEASVPGRPAVAGKSAAAGTPAVEEDSAAEASSAAEGQPELTLPPQLIPEPADGTPDGR